MAEIAKRATRSPDISSPYMAFKRVDFPATVFTDDSNTNTVDPTRVARRQGALPRRES